jgi:hypothetical protein
MMLNPQAGVTPMAEPKRQPIVFSHARTTALIVERLGDPARAIEKPALACPSCGARMRFVRRPATVGAPAALVATCALCAGSADA